MQSKMYIVRGLSYGKEDTEAGVRTIHYSYLIRKKDSLNPDWSSPETKDPSLITFANEELAANYMRIVFNSWDLGQRQWEAIPIYICLSDSEEKTIPKEEVLTPA